MRHLLRLASSTIPRCLAHEHAFSQHPHTRPISSLSSSLSLSPPTMRAFNFWSSKSGGLPFLVSSAASQYCLLQLQQQRDYATKLKKYKIKAFSSYKRRFREKADGEYKRQRAGKRHNAHSKTNKQIRQLRKPSVVPLTYAKVMKKLNFHG